MKILLDMPVPSRVAARLREKGYDAFHLRERSLQKLADYEILELAIKEERIIVSMDNDFPQLIATQSKDRPSVILFRIHNPRYAEVCALLIHVLERYEPELERGSILSIADSNIRIRSLPISD